MTEEDKEECTGCELLNYKRDQYDKLRKKTEKQIKELKKIALANEKAIAELKEVLANREKFMDWCSEHHPEVMSEYLD